MLQSVHVDYRKWPDRKHWHYTMERLGQDEHGLWLWAPPGTRLQRGDEPPKPSKRLHVKLVPPDAWWCPIWNEADEREIYVDIITPAKWNGPTVTMIDLDLDVVRYRDGRTEVYDEDEFLDHQVRYGYPADLIAKATAVTAEIEAALAGRTEPFDKVGEAWLRWALALDSERGV
jgi:predicted RNA-binding protein associated with RNAse of E/G family